MTDSILIATKIRENRIRRAIGRMGHRLEKSPRRDPLAHDFALWRIVREGEPAGPFSMTLTEIETWVSSSRPQAGTPQNLRHANRWAPATTIDVRVGDCRKVLPRLAPNTFSCCVTSPPYYFVRDSGRTGQIGMEKTVGAYIENLVGVFRQVRRVLKDDGTLWIVIDDLMCTRRAIRLDGKRSVARDMARGTRSVESWGEAAAAGRTLYSARLKGEGLKDKDMMLIPQRLALALLADGWWLRADIIWVKPHVAPAPVKDRPGHSYEHVLLLSKRAHYYFDGTALRERGASGQRPGRDVWTIRPSNERTEHTAMFPVELAAKCLMAGSPLGGSVLDPFGGLGTTALAAAQHGRGATLIEINEESRDRCPNTLGSCQWGLMPNRTTPPNAGQGVSPQGG